MIYAKLEWVYEGSRENTNISPHKVKVKTWRIKKMTDNIYDEGNELDISNEILSFVQNLYDVKEAKRFADLYIKAINVGRVENRFDYIDEYFVMRHIATIDKRFDVPDRGY